MNREWINPLPEPGARHLAQEFRGIGETSMAEMPKWKEKAFGLNPTFGQRTTLSIKEQREGLPIYKLRDELIAAIANNQVLIVVGDTGSGKTTQMTQVEF